MRGFMENHAQTALDALVAKEAGPPSDFECRHGGCRSSPDDKRRAYRCFHCVRPEVMCKSCILADHEHNPCHFVHEWDTLRRFWTRKPLTDLGFILYLGHDGRRCQYSSLDPRKMTIVSRNGVHEMRVGFCKCASDENTSTPRPEGVQLLEIGLWPASWTRPATACTIHMLKEYSLLANQCNVPHYDYWKLLCRKTDNIVPDETSVSHSRQSKGNAMLTATSRIAIVNL